jgi:toxin ParE1/3/4
MSQRRVRLSLSAEQDIANILRCTAHNFGQLQAEFYAKLLTFSLTQLSDGPNPVGVKVRDELGNGVRTLHIARQEQKGRHFVLFRATSSDAIDVLRVLHDSMDLPRHLTPEDLQH